MSCMADPEDQRRRALINSITWNVSEIITHSQELEKRVSGIHLLTQQSDQYFFETGSALKKASILNNTKTDDLVNFYLEATAHLKRVKSINKALDRVHHQMDFFPTRNELPFRCRHRINRRALYDRTLPGRM